MALQVLILAGNKIQTLPDEICELTHLKTLDLTNNEMRSLPMAMYHLTKLTVAHSYHNLDKCGLWLYKNPLEEPPPEVWRTEKSNNIFGYLKRAVTFNIENLQRQKVLVFGESQCGKTCLVTALTLRKSFLVGGPQDKTRLLHQTIIGGPQDKTRLLHQTIWVTDNKVEFVFNDFGGDNVYRTLYRMFLDNKALVLVVYNSETLCEENFYSCIGQWLDMLSASSPGAIVKIVGTHADLLHANMDKDEKEEQLDNDHKLKLAENSTDDAENGDLSLINPQSTIIRTVSNSTSSVTENKEIIYDLLHKYLNLKDAKTRAELESLENDIKKVEKSGQMKVNEASLMMLRVREKKLKDILQNPLKILPEISFISSARSLEGIHKLTDELELLAIDKTIFPHNQRFIPGHWKQLSLILKQRKGFYLYWDDVQNIAERFNVKNEELRECINHLHGIADVIWFCDDSALSQIVFHKPKVLVNIITSLYRHDSTDFLNYDNKAFLCKGRMNSQQFQECAEIFTHTGAISRPLLNCFLFQFNFNNDDIAQLLELLPLLEISYSVPEPDVPTGHLYNRPLMVLPWYNKDTDMALLKEVWSDPKEETVKELVVFYTFPFFYPPEIIPCLSVQIQDFVDERSDWKDFIYASRDTQKMLLYHTTEGDRMLHHTAGDSMFHHTTAEDNNLLTILVRGSDFSETHTFMEELVNLVNMQLLRYPGLYWKLTIPMGVGNLKNVTGSSC